MNEEEMKLIRTVIESEHELGSQVLLQFERLGEPAFTELARQLQSQTLSPKQQVFALRALSLLTRQQCWDRKEQLLELALKQTESPHIGVRSGAVNMAIAVTLQLEGSPNLAKRPENQPGSVPRLRERVQKVVSRALAQGLDEEHTELAQGFLENRT